MSVFDEKKDELERYEFMMGPARGRLAVSMDLLTDSMALVGQHAVYCRSARHPGQPAMDIRMILEALAQAKELISSVMEELRRQREAERG